MFEAPTRRRALKQLGAFGCAAWPALAAGAPGVLVRWPEVSLLDGSRWGPQQAKDRAVVAVFWSVTCPFCRRHNEHVEKLHRAAAGKPLTVIGISRDKDPALVRRYVAERGYAFPVTLEADPLRQQLGARQVIPLTVTVDRRGRLLQSYAGEMFEEDVLELLALAGSA